MKSQRIAILTGFACLVDFDPKIETDGIAGAFAIAKALAVMGRNVSILMDKHSESIMKEITANYFNEFGTDLLTRVNLQCFTPGKGALSEDERA